MADQREPRTPSCMRPHRTVAARLPRLWAAYAAELVIVVGALTAAVVVSVRTGTVAMDTVVGTAVALLVVGGLGRAIHTVELRADGVLEARAPLRRTVCVPLDTIDDIRWVHTRMALVIEHPSGSLALSWRLVGLDVLAIELARCRGDLEVRLPAFARRSSSGRGRG